MLKLVRSIVSLLPADSVAGRSWNWRSSPSVIICSFFVAGETALHTATAPPPARTPPRAIPKRHMLNPKPSPDVRHYPIPLIGRANEENRRQPKQSRILGEQILSSTGAFIRTE